MTCLLLRVLKTKFCSEEDFALNKKWSHRAEVRLNDYPLFLSPPPFREGFYSFVRVMYVCILLPLRRYWSKSNVQYMKWTWRCLPMSTGSANLPSRRNFEPGKNMPLNSKSCRLRHYCEWNYFFGYEPALLFSLNVFLLTDNILRQSLRRAFQSKSQLREVILKSMHKWVIMVLGNFARMRTLSLKWPQTS